MCSTFDLLALRFHFTASSAIHFPAGNTVNLFRGQLGKIMKHCAGDIYSQFFAPISHEGPSGLRDLPRPFVFRANHLEGVALAPGERFHIGINLFETRAPAIDLLSEIFAELMRGRAVFQSADGREALRLEFAAHRNAVERMRVRFLTPTELKGAERPEFGVLFARIRDRVSTLRALYGAGPLEIDFKAMGERAALVRIRRCEIEHMCVERVSGSTGQRHSLGGFTGIAEYEGDLGEFLPFLEIARWTGVGRQTVWGKGEIACEAF